MAKKSKSSKSSKSKPVASGGKASDKDKMDELNRKASGNTLHAQQAQYYEHRVKAGAVSGSSGRSNVEDEDVILED